MLVHVRELHRAAENVLVVVCKRKVGLNAATKKLKISLMEFQYLTSNIIEIVPVGGMLVSAALRRFSAFGANTDYKK